MPTIAYPTEKEFQATVVEYAKLQGWMVYHTFDSRRSEPGFPDLVLVRGEDLAFVELKAEGKKTTEAQRRWLDAVAGAGAEQAVWWPSMWPEIEKYLT